MITVTEIKKKSENLYTEYLKSIVSGETFFPKTIRSDKSVSNDFGEMRKELAEVIGHSKDNKNYGYTINYKQINTRKHKTCLIISSFFLKYNNLIEEQNSLIKFH